MLDFIKSTTRTGLSNEMRTQLLSKFEVKEALLVLGPPKLNKMLLPILKASSTVCKRDGYQALAQSQVAAALNALGMGLSYLTRAEVASCLPEDAKSALSQIAEASQLLADHQYRLSLARRAFIKPALNLLGKSTADLAPIDEWLFGTSFVDEVKDAQACEKVARVLARAPAATSKAPPQSAGKAQLVRKQAASGNSKAPARQSNQPYRRAGAYQSRNRPRRSLSRSRARRH
ncbi:hypothetical protein ALC62_10925 [Cyphomyrmex costatus]|uniref:Uncharacterized protein n=2 Tax=Cyphomyrmex costatus TaxID=456900 RepID=A0A151K2K1_9HYME|nr:hypothetical protein ALC62_10925 [Cyphomyrmex costatus]